MVTSRFNWPPRKNPSKADQLQMRRQEMRHNFNVEGQVYVYGNWDDVLQRRPLDIPLYTAPMGRAVIAVLVSNDSMQSDALADVCASGLPFGLHVRTFDQAGYPVLRMNLFLPDDLQSPLCLEAPLDVRDGDVQDFIDAVIKDEQIEMVLAHEAGSSPTLFPAEARGLAVVLEAEARRAIAAVPADASGGQFKAAVAAMERAFPRATAGIDPRHVVHMRPLGQRDQSQPANHAEDIGDAVGTLDHGGARYNVFITPASFVSELVRARHAALQTTFADIPTAFREAFAGLAASFGVESDEARALPRSELFCGECGSALARTALATLLISYANVARPTRCPRCASTALIVVTRL